MVLTVLEGLGWCIFPALGPIYITRMGPIANFHSVCSASGGPGQSTRGERFYPLAVGQ